ncbi:MAG: type II toxin-antitoxin system VapC family toxin [Gaiella sp.]|nr:type II toxin-antitoxin system VapC family toxin [Gaiella sp.]
MILVDSNVPMYLVGAEHPLKHAARSVLEEAIAGGERLVADAEVFREILHRYVAIERRDAIQPAFDLLRAVVDATFAVELADVERAKGLVVTTERLSARDAVHVAVMYRHGIERIMSFDAGFDGIPGIMRVS